ncbi:hypothetical protein EUGRSUZ_H03686 [Eucalyptus grandis]|uniref:Uncharacterized protein n=2 Tax=Eucalyptus grandis TaxID=71139 RepID=A0A059B4N1_EUCGR|nr:hypothetical protein EUGRSUZ_H03686 [Eucalyptus grandis]
MITSPYYPISMFCSTRGHGSCCFAWCKLFLGFIFCEITSEGRRITKLDQILLNGNNIAIVRNNFFLLLILMWLYVLSPCIDKDVVLPKVLLVPGGSPDLE